MVYSFNKIFLLRLLLKSFLELSGRPPWLLTNSFPMINRCCSLCIEASVSIYFNFYNYVGKILCNQNCKKLSRKSFAMEKICNRIILINVSTARTRQIWFGKCIPRDQSGTSMCTISRPHPRLVHERTNSTSIIYYFISLKK